MKIILFFLTSFFYTTLTFATNDCIDCTPDTKAFDELVKKIESTKIPLEINCKDLLKEEARDEYLKNFGDLPLKKQNIKGLKLEGSQDELKALDSMLGSVPNDKWSLAKDCNTVVCALTKMYDSEEAAYRVLNIAKRDGYIVSAAKDFGTKKSPEGQLFSKEEIVHIDLAYKVLPDSLKKLSSLQRLKRMPSGKMNPKAPRAAAYASPAYNYFFSKTEGEITFLDGSFTRNKSWPPLVAVHELIHHVDFSHSPNEYFGISLGEEYLRLSGWRKNESYKSDEKTGQMIKEIEWNHDKDKKFISQYASTQPIEDFAESAAHYVYAPNELKLIDPAKYEFIKNNIFGGKEYLKKLDNYINNKDIIMACLKEARSLDIYGTSIVSSPPISEDCFNKLTENYKINSPEMCQYNSDQIKAFAQDQIIQEKKIINGLFTEIVEKHPTHKDKCYQEKNYQKKCGITSYFQSKKSILLNMNLNDDEAQRVIDQLSKKVNFINSDFRHSQIIKSVISNLGKQNFLASLLMNGLKDKNKLSSDYPLTRQRAFLDEATRGLRDQLAKENYKFDDEKSIQTAFESHIFLDTEINQILSSFQANVYKKATRSKEKNLDLIKAWAKEHKLEDSPIYSDLAELIKNNGSLFKTK